MRHVEVLIPEFMYPAPMTSFHTQIFYVAEFTATLSWRYLGAFNFANLFFSLTARDPPRHNCSGHNLPIRSLVLQSINFHGASRLNTVVGLSICKPCGY